MIIKHYKRVGFSMDIMRQPASLVVKPITVSGYGFLFNLYSVGQCLMFIYSWAHHGSTLALTVCELRAFFVSIQYIDIVLIYREY